MSDKIWVKVKAKSAGKAALQAQAKHKDYTIKKIVMFDVPTYNVEMQRRKSGRGIAKY